MMHWFRKLWRRWVRSRTPIDELKLRKNPILISQAKWAKQLRHQFSTQSKVDVQFRSGYVELITDRKTHRYYVDIWLQKRLAEFRPSIAIAAFKQLSGLPEIDRYQFRKIKNHATYDHYRRNRQDHNYRR